MKIRDRIVDFRRVPARDLLPNPKNWRRHPQQQQDALRGLLSEIGYADVAVRRWEDFTGKKAVLDIDAPLLAPGARRLA